MAPHQDLMDTPAKPRPLRGWIVILGFLQVQGLKECFASRVSVGVLSDPGLRTVGRQHGTDAEHSTMSCERLRPRSQLINLSVCISCAHA